MFCARLMRVPKRHLGDAALHPAHRVLGDTCWAPDEARTDSPAADRVGEGWSQDYW